jgi:hypothetical chaperone protein
MDREITYLGLDFGTTNTVASIILPSGERRRQSFTSDLGETANFRSIICYWQEFARGVGVLHHSSGPFGILDYLKWGADQRLIMSMKSYLGDRNFSGTTIHGSRFAIEHIITDFLDDLFSKHCPDINPEQTRVVVGRPVVFVGVKADDALAIRRMRSALSPFGFASLDFALEPAAAGYRHAKSSLATGTFLVADFGGGTADFSVLEFDGNDADPFRPIAHTGIGIAGDQFDNRIVNHAIAPILGKGGTYDSFGKTLPIPWASSDLMWHRLALLNTHENLRYWDGVRRQAHAPEPIERLINLIENNLGFQMAQAVASAREALSRDTDTVLDLTKIGLSARIPLAREDFETWISEDLESLRGKVSAVLDEAAITPDEVDHVFMTGGTSQTPAIGRIFTNLFGERKISGGGVFSSVADGLAELALDQSR